MNYLKIYKDLIEKRISNPYAGAYSETHHIIPKSLSSDSFINSLLNEYNNCSIVTLSLREHYVAHRLLVKICENNKNCYLKMLHALQLLQNRGATSHLYFQYKSQYSELLSETLKGKPSRAKGCKWSDEAKQKKSDNHYMKGKTYEEIYGEEKAKELKENRSKSSKGRKWSEDTRELMKDAFEKRNTPEWREKISLSKKGIALSEETKNKISQFFSNSYLNPNVDQRYFTFKNVKTNEVVIKRKYDMKKEYGCSAIHRLFNGKATICKDWILLSNEPITKCEETDDQ